ncbi:MAG: tetratricopeptide repeat protein [bacterium]
MRRVLPMGINFILVLFFLFAVISCTKLPDDKLMDKAKTLETEEEFQSAVKYYDKLVETYPASPFCSEALYRAGLIYSNPLGESSEAISRLTEVLNEYPESKFAPQSQFMLGFIYANSLSDTVKAKEEYNEFIQKYPDHELVSSVKWELKYLGRDISDIPLINELETESEE